jgi:hypothetical protein
VGSAVVFAVHVDELVVAFLVVVDGFYFEFFQVAGVPQVFKIRKI